MERSHIDGHVMGGVLEILVQVQPPNPNHLFTSYIVPKVPLQPLINLLGLAIFLVVESCVRDEISTNRSEDLLPESSHEPVVLITHYVLSKPMELEDLPKKHLSTCEAEYRAAMVKRWA